MISGIGRLVLLSIAMVAFLAAAKASAGLSWRVAEPAHLMLGSLKTSSEATSTARDVDVSQNNVSLRF